VLHLVSLEGRGSEFESNMKVLECIIYLPENIKSSYTRISPITGKQMKIKSIKIILAILVLLSCETKSLVNLERILLENGLL
jgi:hypothetical protein